MEVTKTIKTTICDVCNANNMETKTTIKCSICNKDLCKEHSINVKLNACNIGNLCEKDLSIKNIQEVIEKSKLTNGEKFKILEISVFCK